ncbi:MAG: hypothetical protein WKF81_09300, partial [Thermomicrobiales bacterium]
MQAGSDQSRNGRSSGSRESLMEVSGSSRSSVAGKREVDLYVRTYITLLQSSGAVSVASLEPAHLTSASSLHAGAEEPEPDFSAFLYSAQRIPQCIASVQHVILGQTLRAFVREGYAEVETWQAVSAPGRRRRWYWNGEEILAAYIASASDLDDLIPSIVAYQFEWNKMNRLLEQQPEITALISLAARGTIPDDVDGTLIREALLLEVADWERLVSVWGASFWTMLNLVATTRKRIDFRMLGGTFLGYGRSTRTWWRPVMNRLADLNMRDRPIYFVSSNTHSIVNTLSGVAT